MTIPPRADSTRIYPKVYAAEGLAGASLELLRCFVALKDEVVQSNQWRKPGAG